MIPVVLAIGDQIVEAYSITACLYSHHSMSLLSSQHVFTLITACLYSHHSMSLLSSQHVFTPITACHYSHRSKSLHSPWKVSTLITTSLYTHHSKSLHSTHIFTLITSSLYTHHSKSLHSTHVFTLITASTYTHHIKSLHSSQQIMSLTTSSHTQQSQSLHSSQQVITLPTANLHTHQIKSVYLMPVTDKKESNIQRHNPDLDMAHTEMGLSPTHIFPLLVLAAWAASESSCRSLPVLEDFLAMATTLPILFLGCLLQQYTIPLKEYNYDYYCR